MGALSDLWFDLVRGVHRYLLDPAGLTAEDVRPFFADVPQFVAILVIFLALAKAIIWLSTRLFFSPKRIDPMVTRLVGRLVYGVLVFVGLGVALTVFGINIFGLAVTIGLIGAALALGLQNTVANIMGGVSLVMDRPFEVGDRVQVGDFWGDVEEIGLRSTRILTTRREYVIIPNRLMDEREIWNYTKRYPELRIDMPISISYDSDLQLARSLLMRVASEHPGVLAFPKPRVMVEEFGDSGMHLSFQVFIAEPRARTPLSSELRERAHDIFREHGVEIPYPYRTVVYKTDLPTPHRADDEGAPIERPVLGRRRVLVATAGATPAVNKAQTIVGIAKDLDADLIVAYISPRTSVVTQREGERAAAIFNTAAERQGVQVKLVVGTGVVVDAIRSVVERERCGAVIIGANRSPVLLAWKNANVEERLRHVLDVPVIVIPPSLEVDQGQVREARAALDRIAPGGDGGEDHQE